MWGIQIPVSALHILEQIDVFQEKESRFPEPIDLCQRDSERGPIIRSYKELESAGLISRTGKFWKGGSVTKAGHDWLNAPGREQFVKRRQGESFELKVGTVKLTASQKRTFAIIVFLLAEHGSFPSTTTAAAVLTDGQVKQWNRAHTVNYYRQLEELGLIGRTGHGWAKTGFVTPLGIELSKLMPAETKFGRTKSVSRRGGGLSNEGGTRYPDMLFSVDSPDIELIKLSPRNSKLGDKVRVGGKASRQMNKKIATFSLEEGKTCSPSCGLRDVCYAGKMSREKRVLYEGKKTDRAMAQAICESGPLHYRLNTVGDMPNQSFFEAVFAAIAVTNSSAYGYTHWQPETELGNMIRELSDYHWDFFSIRTSYEHGSRKPLKNRAAVVVPDFDPDILAQHNAVACPEEKNEKRNCGECGFCWLLKDKNIAFRFH